MKKFFLIVLIFCLTGLMAQARTPYFTGLSYQISFPAGNTYDFINSTSFAGAGIEGHRFLGPSVSTGFSMDWNYFYKDNRRIHAFPALFNVRVYLGQNWNLKPFLGFGIGTYYLNTHALGYWTHTWHFGLSPEFGFAIRRFRNFGMMFSARYHYAFASGSISDQSYWTIKIGSFWGGY